MTEDNHEINEHLSKHFGAILQEIESLELDKLKELAKTAIPNLVIGDEDKKVRLLRKAHDAMQRAQARSSLWFAIEDRLRRNYIEICPCEAPDEIKRNAAESVAAEVRRILSL